MSSIFLGESLDLDPLSGAHRAAADSMRDKRVAGVARCVHQMRGPGFPSGSVNPNCRYALGPLKVRNSSHSDGSRISSPKGSEPSRNASVGAGAATSVNTTSG